MNEYEVSYTSNHAGCLVSLVVSNGELVRAVACKYYEKDHNLAISHPDWSLAQECLEALYYDDKIEFRKLVSSLNQNSRGMQCVRNIKKNLLFRAQSKVAEIEASLDWV